MPVSWPAGQRLALFLRLHVLLTFLFVVVYGGANWLAGRSGRGSTLHFAWELAIPLLPPAILIYFSIAILFWLPLFVCDVDGLRRLGRRLALATLAAGTIFVALPLRTGFARIPPEGVFHDAFAVLWGLDGSFNAMPSLHVAYSTLVFCALAGRVASRQLRRLGALWYLAICASVLLVHQHHLADVVGGMALAWAAGSADKRWRRINRDAATP